MSKNNSIKDTKVFKNVFGLLKSDTAIKAGYSAVEKGLNNRVKNIDKVTELVKKYDTLNTTAAQNKVKSELKKYGLSGKMDDITPEQVRAFGKSVEELRPNMDAFKEDSKKFIKNDSIAAAQFAKGVIKDYYKTGTKGQKATRIGLTAGAYVGGALGLRMLDGGTSTTNAEGERDIAGIPFV